MVGQPGRSGGARKGAGRPKKEGATPRTQGSVWMATRERIFKRDKCLCQCTECKASATPLGADEVDHIIPLIDGGADEDSNLQALNAKCHRRKTSAEATARAAAAYVAPGLNPIADCDMLTMLKNVALGRVGATALQVRAAIAAVQYTHTKKGDGGKKEEQASKAQKAATGKFASAPPPKLVVNNKS